MITLGKCSSGTRYNIVPEVCELEGTCRTFDEKVRDLAQRRLGEILQGVCTLSGCTGTLHYERGYMALVNDAAMVDFAERVAGDLLGREAVHRMETPSMCAEDFAFYLRDTPGAFFWLGSAKTQDAAPLHNSRFDPDEAILWRGAALLSELVLRFDPNAAKK